MAATTSTNNPAVSNANNRLSATAGPQPSANDLMDLLSSMDQLLAESCPEDGGFESACGSPSQPVDLSTLDCISLDFPLNSTCGIGYHEGGEGGEGGEPPSADNTPSFSALISVSSGLDHNHELDLLTSQGSKAHVGDNLDSSKRMKCSFSAREQAFVKEGIPWEVNGVVSSQSRSSSGGGGGSNNNHVSPMTSAYNKQTMDSLKKSVCSGGSYGEDFIKQEYQNDDREHTFNMSEPSIVGHPHRKEDPAVPSVLVMGTTKKIGDGTRENGTHDGVVVHHHHQRGKRKGDEDGGKRGINQPLALASLSSSSSSSSSSTTSTTTTYRMSMRICEKRRIGEDWNGLKDLPPMGTTCTVGPIGTGPPPPEMTSFPSPSCSVGSSSMEDQSYHFLPNNNIYKMIQGLNPVFPAEPRDLQAGHWFRCQLCHTIQETQRLYSHAKEVHNLANMANATTQCISPFRPSFSGASPNATHGSNCQRMTSPGPISLGEWSNHHSQLHHSRQTTTTNDPGDANPLPTSRPPANEIISNQDLPDFEPDLDAVVDDKFIDSLIRTTIPPSGGANPPSNQHQHSMALINPPQSASSGPGGGAAAGAAAGGGLQSSMAVPQAAGPTLMKLEVVSSSGTPTSSSLCPSLPNNLLQGSSSSSLSTTHNSNPSTTTTISSSSSSVNTNIEKKLNREAKKSSPQFRWRRRKRRSKAQYPEMSRYLLPIDEGEEVQHLGRTLECQLCGLRGKRCHLTLHFKAKHSEVIELAGGHLHKMKKPTSKPTNNGNVVSTSSKDGLGKY
ncbi:uncharacterized protein LOC131882381 [Tigriopus californicus]|uniref:uncharacterized protein LOC131882381 n=1 Tax=Tigriopus californicus TaxID=6832 RepID=UPI0027D9DDA4|nr:uncharacterized protein LOC131882381 [Tigriopus californicus]